MRSYLDCKPAIHISNPIASFLDISFVWKLGLVLLLTTNRAATGRHVKSNFMGGTMNFSFQDSPVKQKMGEDVSVHSAEALRFSAWPWKTPSDIRACLCAIWTNSLVCRAALCVPVAWLVVCEPQPWASSCGCPSPARGCWPTWNTIQVSSGPLTHHTLLLGKLA